jgi:hypothetical protein
MFSIEVFNMSNLTCFDCAFYEPRPANHLHGEGYGICRHRRRAYRDYLGDGSSLTVQPIAHNGDAACARYQSSQPVQLSLTEDDRLIRAMLKNSKATPRYYEEAQQ